MTIERMSNLLREAGRICPLCKEPRPESCACDTRENLERIVAEDKAKWPKDGVK
jgi:hypothetical protein